jgi:hypothetical protein
MSQANPEQVPFELPILIPKDHPLTDPLTDPLITLDAIFDTGSPPHPGNRPRKNPRRSHKSKLVTVPFDEDDNRRRRSKISCFLVFRFAVNFYHETIPLSCNFLNRIFLVFVGYYFLSETDTPLETASLGIALSLHNLFFKTAQISNLELAFMSKARQWAL